MRHADEAGPRRDCPTAPAPAIVPRMSSEGPGSSAGEAPSEEHAPRPPYRLRTARLEIRCYEPRDAPDLQAALARNKAHLEPWIPWAHAEPTTVDAKLDRILLFRSGFDRHEDYTYGIFDPDGGALVGGTGLHLRCGPGAADIGYWIDAARGGNGFAREAAVAMTRVGFEHLRLWRLEVRCDPANVRSAAIPQRLGFTEDGTLRARFQMHDGSRRDTRVFSMLDDEYATSPLRHATLVAYDALGRELPPPPPPPPEQRDPS